MSGKIYEMRFYDFNLKGKADFVEMLKNKDLWTLRLSFSRVVGIFETEMNGAAEFFHFVEYDDMEHMRKCKQVQAQSKEFKDMIQIIVGDCGTFKNALTILSPHTPQLTMDFPASPTAVYELQTMRNGNCRPTLGNKGTLVGRFRTMYGQINTEYRLIRFPDPKSAEAAARERMTKEDEMKEMLESRFMLPMPVSELQ